MLRRPPKSTRPATLFPYTTLFRDVLGAFQGGIGVLLAARLGYLAIFENEKYELEAESNRVNLSLIPPRRGWILDRHGAALASNRADFRVDAIPARMTNVAQEIGRASCRERVCEDV